MSERRRLERFDFEIPARIEVATSGRGGEKFRLITSNISSKGAFFPTPQTLPEGTRVKMDMVLPLDRLEKLKRDFRQAYVEVTGTVLRRESNGMAICFNEDYRICPCKATSPNECAKDDLPYKRVAWKKNMYKTKD